MEKINYQKQLDIILESVSKQNIKPSLLLHACCGPCSSYVLEYLMKYFDITIYYYNPNIHPEAEYVRRLNELKTFLPRFDKDKPVVKIKEILKSLEKIESIEDAIKNKTSEYNDDIDILLALMKKRLKLIGIHNRTGIKHVYYAANDYKKYEIYKQNNENREKKMGLLKAPKLYINVDVEQALLIHHYCLLGEQMPQAYYVHQLLVRYQLMVCYLPLIHLSMQPHRLLHSKCGEGLLYFFLNILQLGFQVK